MRPNKHNQPEPAAALPRVSVSRQASRLLPKVLIDYLTRLIAIDRQIAGGTHTFHLHPATLGGRTVLDIFHAGENGAFATHRVFGCESVSAEIVVVCEPESWRMSEANEQFQPLFAPGLPHKTSAFVFHPEPLAV
ncbi:MAG TPA: hypothetical protein P5075_11740 [Eubacteriales bacterium]|nr:hypothetical protein [Eubacteriales bacterium]